MESMPEKSNADGDWENRELCPNGNCIGVIGPDGFCKECGSPSETNRTADSSVPDGHFSEHEDVSADEVTGEFGDIDDSVDADWENRILCGDESCIGVIGPDGVCGECGKSL